MVQLTPLHAKTQSSLPSFPDWFCLSVQVVLENGPLNGCSSSSSSFRLWELCRFHRGISWCLDERYRYRDQLRLIWARVARDFALFSRAKPAASVRYREYCDERVCVYFRSCIAWNRCSHFMQQIVSECYLRLWLCLLLAAMDTTCKLLCKT